MTPADPAVVSLLASSQGKSAGIRRRLQNYRRALELQPDNPAVMNNLPFLLSETGDNLDEALRLAQRGSEFSARLEGFYQNLSQVMTITAMAGSSPRKTRRFQPFAGAGASRTDIAFARRLSVK